MSYRAAPKTSAAVPLRSSFRCGDGRIRCDLARSGGEWSRRNIRAVWRRARPSIEQRLAEFRELWRTATDRELFAELCFCLFTPQSKATNCWETVKALKAAGLLFDGTQTELSQRLNRVRFRHNKARYLLEARKLFSDGNRYTVRQSLSAFSSVFKTREWLVANVKGLGCKEASHFLRNIGLGEDIAILDRHILKNLRQLGAIREVPDTLTPARYLAIEKAMKRFADEVGIPLSHLDLLLWCRETGEIFK
jgi:N-glycosylase/DNA lyase